ncbi:MAG TPA: hypothetical protein PLO37_05845 [Candidatus Hydrogenedentes bacterium]|nr:hypothetical protein [Candidatus Hydrogenedentota bacterium]HPG66351.1 hypothetical protein [Candidatus Hydrogenedentota bacterium]
MKHLKQISLFSGDSDYGETTFLEQMILLLFAAYFADWQNFSSVYQNLQKFYAKT